MSRLGTHSLSVMNIWVYFNHLDSEIAQLYTVIDNNIWAIVMQYKSHKNYNMALKNKLFKKQG